MRADVNATLLERYGRVLQVGIIATVGPAQVIAASVRKKLRLQGFGDHRRVHHEIDGVRARRCNGSRQR
jgi:hypothetical protein